MPALLNGFTGLDGLVFANPVSDFLATITTAIFIVIEQHRIKRLEAGEIKVEEF